MNSAAVLSVALIVILSSVELGLGLDCYVGLTNAAETTPCPGSKNCMLVTVSEFHLVSFGHHLPLVNYMYLAGNCFC